MPTADRPAGDVPDESHEPQPAQPSQQIPGEDADETASRIASPDADTARWRLVARALVGLEALAPLAFAVYGLVQLLGGGSVVRRNETMLVVLMAVTGLALVYVAYAVGLGRRAVRTATLVWQALLVLGPAQYIWQAGYPLLAVLVIAFAVLTGYATVRATRQPAADQPEA